MSKRIILVGPTCSGKSFLRNRFEKRDFLIDISYTTREIRSGEENGVHYHFISVNEFIDRIRDGLFYEWVKYGEDFYGTGYYEWESRDCFIMETQGISEILPEDRKSCFIIYLNNSLEIRKQRMKKERKWSEEQIEKRLKEDEKKFKDFNDYDMVVTNWDF